MLFFFLLFFFSQLFVAGEQEHHPARDHRTLDAGDGVSHVRGDGASCETAAAARGHPPPRRAEHAPRFPLGQRDQSQRRRHPRHLLFLLVRAVSTLLRVFFKITVLTLVCTLCYYNQGGSFAASTLISPMKDHPNERPPPLFNTFSEASPFIHPGN